MWRNILVPTDFSGAARKALRLASLLAPSECSVHLMHVITPVETDPYSPLNLRPELRERQRLPEEVTQELLEQLSREVSAATVLAWRRASDVVHAILDYADTIAAELIVMGTHGRRGLKRFLLGSVAEAVVRRAAIPVLTVRESIVVPEAIRHILVPTDFSEASRCALREAARWAAYFHARLTLLHVLTPALIPIPVAEATAVYDLKSEWHQQLEATLGLWLERERPSGVEATVRIAEGPVDLTILKQLLQDPAELIVMATHGRSGVTRWLLGSVAERVLRQAPCPVLTLRAAPWPPEET